MHKIRHILVFLLCIFWFSSYSQSFTPSNSFINSIEYGVYIDDNLTYPYTQGVITLASGLVIEGGMLDLPSTINIRFNNTVQNKAGRLSYLINNMEEPVEYNGPERKPEWYYYLGTSIQFGKYRVIPQAGFSSTYGGSGKISQYYRVIDVDGAFLDLGLHTQFCERRNFVFFGYSFGVDLVP